MVKLVNRAKMTTATTGTGTITLGSAVTGYQSFTDAGLLNGEVVRYVIEDGNNWEIGSGVYTASGTTLSRSPTESSSSGAAISLSGTAVVYITASASDISPPEIGQVVYATSAPTSGTWLEAGKYYSKASYPALAASLGNIPDFGSVPTAPQATIPIAFSTLTTPSSLAPYYTATNGSVHVVVGNSGAIMTSTNGEDWRFVISPFTTGYRSVVYLNGRFVAVATFSAAAFSVDGYSWTDTILSADTNNANSVAYGAGLYVIVGDNGRVAYSADLVSWTLITPTSGNLSRVIYAGGLFVAAGNNEVITSPDGINWTRRTLNWAGAYNDVIYDGSKFFVAGSAIETSTDGITWTTAYANSARNIIYENGVYLAGAGNSIIHRSLDGVSWTSPNPNVFGAITKVLWNGSLFFAFGSNGQYSTSADGITWTRNVDQSFTNFNTGAVAAGKVVGFGDTASVVLAGATRKVTLVNGAWRYAPQARAGGRNPRRIAYDGVGQYAIVGNNATAFLSPTGQSWSANWMGNSDAVDTVQYINGRYFAGGAPSSGRLFTSTDGLIWTSTVLGSIPFSGFAFGAGVYVAVTGNSSGSNGTIYSSADGTTWTLRQSDTTSFFDVIYANGIFVAVGGTGNGTAGSTVCYTSTDGITWTLRTTLANTGWRRIIYANSLFVIVGSGGRIATSPDGITWTARTSSVTPNLHDIVWNGSLFCAVGNSGAITTSPDGVTWTNRTPSGVAVNILSVAWGSGRFVTASDNVSLTSTDGVNWFRTSTAFRGPLDYIVFTGGRFMAVGSGVVQTSTDGITWKTSDEVQYTAGNVTRVVKHAGVFHALTNTGLYYSVDGLSFLPVRTISTSSTSNVRALAYSGTHWMAVVVANSTYPQTFYTSTDGINWVKATDWGVLTNTTNIAGVNGYLTYGSGNFVMLETSTVPSQNIFANVYTSADNGVTWTPRLVPTGAIPAVVAASDGTTIIAPFSSPTCAMISTDGGVTWSVFAGSENANPVIYTDGVWIIGGTAYTSDLTSPTLLRLDTNTSASRGVYVHDGRIIYTISGSGTQSPTLQTVGTLSNLGLRFRGGLVPFNIGSSQNAALPLRGNTALTAADSFSTTGNIALIGEVDLYSYNTATTFWVPPVITGGLQGQKAYVYAGA